MIYADRRRQRIVVELPKDEAEALALMLPENDGFTRDLWSCVDELWPPAPPADPPSPAVPERPARPRPEEADPA